MKTILIVDDNKDILDGLVLTLSSCLKDYTVLTAENGELALFIMKSRVVDLIMTDLAMPVMDGYRFIEEVRRLFPSLLIFVMTADCGPQVAERLRPFRISRCFEKPFGFHEAVRTISDELEPRQGSAPVL